jgi:hypothetical protein
LHFEPTQVNVDVPGIGHFTAHLHTDDSANIQGVFDDGVQISVQGVTFEKMEDSIKQDVLRNKTVVATVVEGGSGGDVSIVRWVNPIGYERYIMLLSQFLEWAVGKNERKCGSKEKESYTPSVESVETSAPSISSLLERNKMYLQL